MKRIVYKLDQEREQKIIADLKSGMTLTAASRKYNHKIEIIKKVLERKGIAYEPQTGRRGVLTSKQREEAIRAYREGQTPSDLAKEYGVARATMNIALGIKTTASIEEKKFREEWDKTVGEIRRYCKGYTGAFSKEWESVTAEVKELLKARKPA